MDLGSTRRLARFDKRRTRGPHRVGTEALVLRRPRDFAYAGVQRAAEPMSFTQTSSAANGNARTEHAPRSRTTSSGAQGVVLQAAVAANLPPRLEQTGAVKGKRMLQPIVRAEAQLPLAACGLPSYLTGISTFDGHALNPSQRPDAPCTMHARLVLWLQSG